MESITFSPDRLREAREAAGLSQAKAAIAAGVARGTIKNAESGAHTPQADALARMACVYGVSLDSLFVHAGDGTRPVDSAPLTNTSPVPAAATR